MRTFQLAFALGFLAQFAMSAEPHTELPKALDEAQAHDKPVFIYVYDSIRGRFCRALEKEPEADRAFAKLAPKFVILHFNTPNGRARHVARLKVKRN